MAAFLDITGMRFGRLVATEYAGIVAGRTSWLCACDCGKSITARSNNLRTGRTESCGCLQAERTSAAKKRHGMARTRLYRIWKAMRRRCERKADSAYQSYGGRGISVCREWATFEPFRNWSMSNGYSPRLSIDRIDNNGNYSPSNCRWATESQQARNKRTTRIVIVGGESMCLAEACEKIGIKYNTVIRRIYRGDPADTLFRKPKADRKQKAELYLTK